jgi:hypothetical protein
LKILDVTPQPTAEELAAIAAALKIVETRGRPNEFNGRINSTAATRAPWLEAARREALDDGV